MVLDDRVKRLLDGCPFAVLATLNPDGTPQTSVIWVARDGDVLVFTTHDQRRKARNLPPVLRHQPGQRRARSDERGRRHHRGSVDW